MVERPKLVAMVGLPRSGKTTIVREKYLANGYAVVSPDFVRVAIHGERFVASAEPFVLATVYAMVDALLLAGCNVVVDSCAQTEARREPWVKRGATFHVVRTSAGECIARAVEKGDAAIIPVIEKMAREYTVPRTEPPEGGVR